MGVITAPVPLEPEHNTADFNCGNATLNEWLKKRALKNQINGASRTFVICQSNQVIGYYALASGSIERLSAPKPIARNMPEPIPVMVLGRLAIDVQNQRQRLGAALLKDALLRTLAVARNAGVRALLVHAISEDAKRYYQGYGFVESPMDTMTLMLSIKHIEAHL